MHQMSPGVERAVAGARHWAERLGSETLRLTHFLLALLDEEEGRPAILLESVGLNPAAIRTQLETWRDSPAAPADAVLFSAARDWSLAYRHDPEFLTDSFLLAVLRVDAAFERSCSGLGLDAARLHNALVGKSESRAEPDLPLAEPGFTAATNAARVLDANRNRAREAARVVEDYVRFVLDDAILTEEVKSLRHALASATGRMPAAALLAARNTPGDVGIDVSAGDEYRRVSPAHVAAVNLKRLQESLRSLEEYGKLLSPELGRDIECLRYRAYALEGAIAGRPHERLRDADLYVILSHSDSAVSLEATIAGAARGGASIIQLREKGLPDRELLARARDVRRWTRSAGVLFIVNDRPDIARLADADGVHLGQDDLSVADARRIAGPDLLVGVSTHTLDQVRSAVLAGADYIGVGPVFPSSTKAFDYLAGLDFVRAAAGATSLPAFALGGITVENVARVVESGANRVAIASAVSRTSNPEAAARELRVAITRAKQPAS
jgi:thiamine-phosphate pyrophosphorylase